MSIHEIFASATDTEVSHRTKVGIAKAIEASLHSNCPHYMVGAVLMRQGRVIGFGWNWFKKSSPDSKTRHNGLHAEYSALASFCGYRDRFFDLRGTTLFVARTTRSGKIAMSKPCDGCQRVIASLRISKVYYTNEGGGISFLDLR